MEKLSFKIDNIFYAIIHSNNYKSIQDRPEYDNYMQPQKEVLKNAVLPKIKEVITELIKSNTEYEAIKIDNIKGKYTKNIKIIKVELIYSDEKENINIIYKIFQNIKKEIENKLLQYELYVI